MLADVQDPAFPAGHAHRGIKCESFFMLLHRSHQYAAKRITAPALVPPSMWSVAEQGGEITLLKKKKTYTKDK